MSDIINDPDKDHLNDGSDNSDGDESTPHSPTSGHGESPYGNTSD